MPAQLRQTAPFLRGPIPMSWLAKAAKLPGQALFAGLLLWHEAGMRKSRTVAFHTAKMVSAGFHEDTARRAIRELERASLVTVERLPGRLMRVTLPPASGDSTNPSALPHTDCGPVSSISGESPLLRNPAMCSSG